MIELLVGVLALSLIPLAVYLIGRVMMFIFDLTETEDNKCNPNEVGEVFICGIFGLLVLFMGGSLLFLVGAGAMALGQTILN